jgi:hypothetical protein
MKVLYIAPQPSSQRKCPAAVAVVVIPPNKADPADRLTNVFMLPPQAFRYVFNYLSAVAVPECVGPCGGVPFTPLCQGCGSTAG